MIQYKKNNNKLTKHTTILPNLKEIIFKPSKDNKNTTSNCGMFSKLINAVLLNAFLLFYTNTNNEAIKVSVTGGFYEHD